MVRAITVIGAGYVGLVTAIGLADFGNNVQCVDLDKSKIKKLKKGIPTIYEAGLEVYLNRNIAAGRIQFSHDVERSIRESEVIFIAVGTPSDGEGETDLAQVDSVVESIGNSLNGYKVIVTKSTVPVGKNRRIQEYLQKRTNQKDFDVVSNPEFLREGKAIQDFFHPDRIIIGHTSEEAKKIMNDIYSALYLIETPFIWCSLETAELIKYASNAFLATKITFINQVANLAESVGADVHIISKAMGMDGRISSKFLHPGPGYGGSCFPKDTKALYNIAKSNNINLSLIHEVIESNERQKEYIVEKVKKLAGSLEGKRVCVLGLSFKAETDDVRESPSISIIRQLRAYGATVVAHDPMAISNFKKIMPDIDYHENEYIAAKGVDVLVICTEWNEYRNMDLNAIKRSMKGNIIVDARNVLNMNEAKRLNFIYSGVGRQ